MIAFPLCKINLGLSIIAKRPDGYHELETIFYPLPLQDMVEIIPTNLSNASVQFSSSGLAIPGEADQNLCVKAYHLLKKDFPAIPSIKIHLHKHIPMGAGLGGGSSDGTAVLLLMNNLFHLGLSEQQLIKYATQLGSDCPFFVYSTACHATGRGEILTPHALHLSNYKFALIHPGIHISTAWAFSALTPKVKTQSLIEIIAQPIEQWKNILINDFELPIFSAHPILENIKKELYAMGAIYASMSGSGSSMFGIFPANYTWPEQFMHNQFRVDFI